MALASHTCADRWGVQDNPGPDTEGSVLQGPPSISLAVGGVCVEGVGEWTWQLPSKPLQSQESKTMWATGGSCLSPGVLALPLPSPYSPPESTSSSGGAAWAFAGMGSHTTHGHPYCPQDSTAPSFHEPEPPALPPSPLPALARICKVGVITEPGHLRVTRTQ